MQITLLLFINSLAKDYAPAMLGRLNKYFPKIKSYLGINSQECAEEIATYYTFDKTILYDNSLRWPQKMANILSKIEEDYVFFIIDNNIFIDNFSIEELERYLKYIKENNIDQLRMIPSSVSIPPEENDIGIYENKSTNYIFSVQPAIWKRKTLLHIMEKFSYVDYREIELECSNYCKQFKNYFVYSSRDFKERINNFSYACPIIHALTCGKWIINPDLYKKEIIILADEYTINLDKRGFTA
jgi:hypothetical protein